MSFWSAPKPYSVPQTNNPSGILTSASHSFSSNALATNAYNAFNAALVEKALAAQQANQPKMAKGQRKKPDGDCITLFAIEGGDNVIPIYVPVGMVEVDNAYLSLPAQLFRTREDAEQVLRTRARSKLNEQVVAALRAMTSAAVKHGLCEPVDLALLDALNAYAEACKS